MKNMKVGFFANDVPEKLIFANNEVEFPEIYFRYAFAVRAFQPEIDRTVARMEASFDEEIGSLDSFVECGSSWVTDKLNPLIDFTMDQLSLNGCYSISKEDFYQKYVYEKLSDIPSIYDSMEEALNRIREKQEEENARRVARRRANVAAGNNEFAEFLRNGVGRCFDGLSNMGEAEEIYNSTVRQRIKNEFIYICNTMVDSFADALYDFANVDLRCPISEEDHNRAKVMFDNLKANKIPESRVDDVALEIFEKNPITPGFINWAVARYGDPDGEMQKIADAFHVPIEDTKQELLERVFDALDFSSEQKTLISKTTLEKEEKRLQYSNDEYRSAIEKKLAEFDLKARTVDGIEYDTREKARKAAELSKAFKKIDFSSEESTLAGKEKYLALEEKAGFTVPKYQKKIDEVLASFDQAARTVDEIEFDSREKAQKAAKLKDVFDGIDFSSEESTLAGKEKYLALEKEFGLTIEKYHKMFDEALKKMDQEARTFDGVEYDSREMAQDVKNQTISLVKTLKSEKFDTIEQIQSAIDKIQQGNYTIEAADKAKDRLTARLEMVKFYPLGKVELIRLLLQPKFKVIITFSLLLLMGIFSPIPLIGILFFAIYLIWLASLFFTTRKDFAKYMESFIRQKSYKAAAFCYELSYQTMQDFLMLPQSDKDKGKD